MPSLPVLLAIVEAVVAVVSMLMRANVPQVVAFLIAIYVILATIYWGTPTTLPDGAQCPGVLYDAVMPSECLKRFQDGKISLLWIWIIGIPAFIGFVVAARAEHAKKAKEE